MSQTGCGDGNARGFHTKIATGSTEGRKGAKYVLLTRNAAPRLEGFLDDAERGLTATPNTTSRLRRCGA